MVIDQSATGEIVSLGFATKRIFPPKGMKVGNYPIFSTNTKFLLFKTMRWRVFTFTFR